MRSTWVEVLLHSLENVAVPIDQTPNVVELPLDHTPNSISMVPSRIRDLSPNSFNPRVVAIGPLHRKDETLKAFEGQKVTCMQKLIEVVGGDAVKIVSECVNKVETGMQRIRASYAQKIDCSDDELAQMMVMDACFIILFIWQIVHPNNESRKLSYGSSIIYDLVLFENQIPFFVLNDIFCCIMSDDDPGLSHITYFLSALLPYLDMFASNFTKIQGVAVMSEHDLECLLRIPDCDHDHLLGFLERCYRLDSSFLQRGLPSSEIHSTVELVRAGVTFKPNDPAEDWKLAMKFKSSKFAGCSWPWPLGKSTLRMPVLRIDYFTELLLRNLIVYEYFSASPGFVTSYVTAMDMLVDTQEDISKLIQSKVVINHLGSNQKAANMINSLCGELPLHSFYYEDQWKDMDRHYKRFWPKNIASLKRNYFSSPWAIIALLVASALFALTIIQTINSF